MKLSVGTPFHSVLLFSVVSLFFLLTPAILSQERSDTKEERDKLSSIASSYYEQLTSGKNPADPEKANAFSQQILNGMASGDNFGFSVSSAGDVNGDGYTDVIVGARNYNSNTGRAYIYFGGLIMDNSIDVTMTGEATGDFFGYSVSEGGDVNGDGYADVIVGAYGNNSGTGRAYIFYGGSIMNNIADVTMTGEATTNYFGTSVSSAGDVNGDGYADVIVGASSYSSSTGRAYIFYGGSSMNNSADVTMTGETTNNYFGFSISTAGDVNGDGFADVIIGALGYSSFAGRAYVYYGGTSMNNSADVTMTGETTSNNFGNSVSTAGDVNGDGYADVIVGASAYSSSTGRAYVYYGGSTMNSTTDVTMTGEATSNNFGNSVSTAGDVNGDGYSDVIVGASGYSTNTGRAYIYLGSSSMDNNTDKTITGESTSNYFGFSVSATGDINGDGYSDVIVGAYGYSSNKGRAYCYQFSFTGTATADEQFTGETAGDYFGYSVASAGDVNGDGYSDIIVGATLYNGGVGRAYIYFGGTAMNNNTDVTMTGEALNSYFGSSVKTAGDVNGDGYSDVIVGAYGYSTNTGRAYIYFGGTSMDNVADVTLTGGGTSNGFGGSVSTAGDVNGDGYADVIVGAYQYSSYTGRAYIYYGGSSMDNTADLTMTGEATGDWFGHAVSAAGDVNGDGYPDVIVGALNYNTSTGRAYIFYGGSSVNNTADVTMTGEGTSYSFGNSVSAAGDVNGDGYADVIVGSNGYSSEVGRAYIYYGGSGMNNTADVTMTGEADNTYLGVSVSNAGDINGDGYADVIVGAHGFFSTMGKSYIFYGGTSMDNNVDVALTGDSSAYHFGESVASAGDVNGDGYVDVIVGARINPPAISPTYLYLSWVPPIAPRIAFVRDVLYDQGGKIKIKWIRSGHDRKGNNTLTSYVIEQSDPAGPSGFFWEKIASVEPLNNPQYSYTAITPNDSMSGNSGAYFFRVTAQTSDANQYWRSNIMSGYSVDNIPPVAPGGGIIAVMGNGNVNISWQANYSDADVGGYNLYRSTTNGFTPSEATLLGTTRDTSYLDATTSLGQEYFYRIRTKDIHGNESASSSQLTADVPLSVEVFSLTVKANRFSAQLNWKTATETNNHGFDIERRATGGLHLEGGAHLAWVKAGFVEGGGTTNAQRSYSYTENYITAGKYEYRLKQISNDGAFRYSPSVEVEIGVAPKVFQLSQNYPNPFNPSTTIEFTVPATGKATLKVFNTLGQEVATLYDNEAEAGKYHQIQFTASGLASGIYVSRLQSGDKIQMMKMMFVK